MNDTTLKWHWLGLGALGFLVGYFVALSESPVVGTLLPLLFGVIAGINGFVLGKTNFESAESLKKVKYWGMGFFAFSLAIFLSSILGLVVKNAITNHDETSIDLSQIEAHTATDLVGLRRRLQILGASMTEQTQIIERAKQQALLAHSSTENVKELLTRFLPAAKELDSALNHSLKSGVNWTEDTSKLLMTLSAVTKSTIPVLNEWNSSQNSSLGLEGIRLILLTTNSAVSNLLGASSSPETEQLLELSKDTTVVGSLFQVKALLDRNINDAFMESDKSNPYTEVDKLTELLVSGKVTQSNLYKLFAYGGDHRGTDGQI